MKEDLLRQIIFCIGAAAFAVGNGGPGYADSGHSHGASIGAPGTTSEVTRTVEIELRDIAFEPSTVNIRTGETIRFVLTNAGSLLHEFSIGTPDMHAEHQKEMQKMMDAGMLTATTMHEHRPGTGMAPMMHDDPNSVVVEPGKTKDLVWKFSEPGRLEFACNIPGHYEAGMVGEFGFRR